ncbi:putative translation initiation inhibitor, yjgF family [Bradyrhizobium sp. WSM1253]|nr:putative translation initiation inhibitor, yjgF family [Bradyrhizobium sp. WSM1253]
MMLCEAVTAPDTIDLQSGEILCPQLTSSATIPQRSMLPPAATAWVELTQHRRLLFISGQVPQRSDGTVPDGFEAQCEQAWRNLIEVLAAAGLGVAHLVKVTTFLTDRAQLVTNRSIRRAMLGEHQPALTVVIVETVDSKWLLEIEAIAAE